MNEKENIVKENLKFKELLKLLNINIKLITKENNLLKNNLNDHFLACTTNDEIFVYINKEFSNYKEAIELLKTELVKKSKK